MAGGAAAARLRARSAAVLAGVLLVIVLLTACSARPNPDAPKEKFPFLYYDPGTY
jgi:hypothetical protein